MRQPLPDLGEVVGDLPRDHPHRDDVGAGPGRTRLRMGITVWESNDTASPAVAIAAASAAGRGTGASGPGSATTRTADMSPDEPPARARPRLEATNTAGPSQPYRRYSQDQKPPAR